MNASPYSTMTEADKKASVAMANELRNVFNNAMRDFVKECDLPDCTAAVAAMTLCIVNAGASWACHAGFTRKEFDVMTRSAFQAVEKSIAQLEMTQ